MKKRLLFLLITAVFVVSVCGQAMAAGRLLSYGDSGDDVYELQQTLAAYGYFYEEPTGYFGELTEEAVTAFQYDTGLAADGIAGPVTFSYLGIDYEEDYGYDDSEDYDEDAGETQDNGGYVSFARTLYSGMEGDDVYLLQQILAGIGYLETEPTGFFGDITADAVRAYQEDCGLTVDGVVGNATFARLLGAEEPATQSGGMDYETYLAAVMDAINRTPATGAGYCAAWVTQVMQNAGILTYNINNLRPSALSYAATAGLTDAWYSDSTGFNANDYWAYVCYSEDPDNLVPGMIVATRSSFTYLGRQFGHVGIYIGDGQIISSVGYLETISVDEWNRRYNNTDLGSTMRWGFLPV